MQVLAEWMFAGKAHQLFNRFRAGPACHLSVERALLNAQPQLVQRGDQPPHGRFVIQVNQWRVVKKMQRRPEHLSSVLRAPLTPRFASGRHEPVKASQIHLIICDVKQVTGLPRNDHVVTKDPAETIDVALDDIDSGSRGGTRPQLIDELIRRYYAALDCQQHQQSLLLRASEGQPRPISRHLERAEEPDLHHTSRRSPLGPSLTRRATWPRSIPETFQRVGRPWCACVRSSVCRTSHIRPRCIEVLSMRKIVTVLLSLVLASSGFTAGVADAAETAVAPPWTGVVSVENDGAPADTVRFDDAQDHTFRVVYHREWKYKMTWTPLEGGATSTDPFATTMKARASGSFYLMDWVDEEFHYKPHACAQNCSWHRRTTTTTEWSGSTEADGPILATAINVSGFEYPPGAWRTQVRATMSTAGGLKTTTVTEGHQIDGTPWGYEDRTSEGPWHDTAILELDADGVPTELRDTQDIPSMALISPDETSVGTILLKRPDGSISVGARTSDGTLVPPVFEYTGDINASLAADGTATPPVPKSPGTYQVVQSPLAGWFVSGGSCNDPTGDSAIDVAAATATYHIDASENVTCTFVVSPTGTGRIVIRTEIDTDGVPSPAFDYTGDVSGSSVAGEALTVSVTPGTYSVTQGLEQDWLLDRISCDDVDSTGDVATRGASIVVESGETVTCTFTDTPLTVDVWVGYHWETAFFKQLPYGAAEIVSTGFDFVHMTAGPRLAPRLGACIYDSWQATIAKPLTGSTVPVQALALPGGDENYNMKINAVGSRWTLENDAGTAKINCGNTDVVYPAGGGLFEATVNDSKFKSWTQSMTHSATVVITLDGQVWRTIPVPGDPEIVKFKKNFAAHTFDCSMRLTLPRDPNPTACEPD